MPSKSWVVVIADLSRRKRVLLSEAAEGYELFRILRRKVTETCKEYSHLMVHGHSSDFVRGLGSSAECL